MDKSEDKGRDTAQSGAATHIALDAARGDPELREDARTLLREQARLARIQADDLNEEQSFNRWALKVKHASEVMKFAFELSIALVLVAIVAALGTAMWSAAHDNGLVIEAFSVPPDLAQRGLGGEVVASQLLDKLTRMQQETNSIRPADTYRNNWGDDIKVEIPDTGISIGELNRYLRHWLGNETHITGEIYRTPSGIAVTARARDAGSTFTGKEADLDKLLQKAAESIYSETQPYRYAAFLDQMGRNDDAMKALQSYAPAASPAERAWALSLLGNLYTFYGHPREALETLRAAVAADPTNAHAWDNLASCEQSLEHMADGYRHTQEALRLYDSGSVAFDPERVGFVKLQDRAFLASTLGDFASAASFDEAIAHRPDRGGSFFQSQTDEAGQIALDHDFSRARNSLASLRPADANERVNEWFQAEGVAYVEHDWRVLVQQLSAQDVNALAPPSFHSVLQSVLLRLPDAMLADAKAEMGDIAGARKLIAVTPLDCYDCVRMRGKIDTAARNWDGAAYWFALAVRQGPFIPFALNDWGEMLLQKGDIPGAIAKLAASAEAGPHYPDPLELWGEALMRENRSDLALEKFEDANRYAPKWGRLHLMWGEAYFYLRRKAEAKAQWNEASRLDLSAADREALAALINRAM